MRYALQMHEKDSFTLFTELGGYSNIYYDDGCWRTQYFREDWRVVDPEKVTHSIIREWVGGDIYRPDAKTLMMVFILDAIEYLHGPVNADDLILVNSLDKLKGI